MTTKEGVGAELGSKRREYRKFRKPPTSNQSLTVVCKFFNSETGCKFGNKCRFKHENKKEELIEHFNSLQIEKEENKPATVYHPPKTRQQIVVTKPVKIKLTKAQKETDEQKQLLEAEIAFFKRRNKNCKIVTSKNETDISFQYNVTDPDWVFELKLLNFNLKLLPTHPIDPPTLTVPENTNQCLPDVVRSYLKAEINKAIQEKYKIFEKRDSFEAIGKALIMWLDHSIMQIFVEGLKRTKLALQGEDIGLTLVVPKQQTENKLIENVPEKIKVENACSASSSSEESCVVENVEESTSEISKNDENEKKETFKAANAFPIDVVLMWKDISGNVATLRCSHLKINMKCARCGTERDVNAGLNDSQTPNGWRCSKCQQAESIRLRSLLVHQNSNIICQMETKGCKPIDCILLESTFLVTCLKCDKEDFLQKMNYGDVHKSWCRFCHSLIELSFSNIRFRGNFEKCNGEDQTMAGKIPKQKKIKENRVTIEEGKNLPDLGTCEHYKKSFRWFRFPCCGKLYPCDTCHELKSAGEHEMKIANRMVCGHCSKEQPLHTNKLCIGCGEGVIRRRTQYWEGGKGCRDQTKMNRNDGHKFANSRKKTIAKTKVPNLLTKKK